MNQKNAYTVRDPKMSHFLKKKRWKTGALGNIYPKSTIFGL